MEKKNVFIIFLTSGIVLFSIFIVNYKLSLNIVNNNNHYSNDFAISLSDEIYLSYNDSHQEHDSASSAIQWSFNSSKSYVKIKVLAMDKPNYIEFSNNRNPSTSYVLSNGDKNSDSGIWTVPKSDTWYIVFWNIDSSKISTSITYEVKFDPVLNPIETLDLRFLLPVFSFLLIVILGIISLNLVHPFRRIKLQGYNKNIDSKVKRILIYQKFRSLLDILIIIIPFIISFQLLYSSGYSISAVNQYLLYILLGIGPFYLIIQRVLKESEEDLPIFSFNPLQIGSNVFGIFFFILVICIVTFWQYFVPEVSFTFILIFEFLITYLAVITLVDAMLEKEYIKTILPGLGVFSAFLTILNLSFNFWNDINIILLFFDFVFLLYYLIKKRFFRNLAKFFNEFTQDSGDNDTLPLIIFFIMTFIITPAYIFSWLFQGDNLANRFANLFPSSFMSLFNSLSLAIITLGLIIGLLMILIRFFFKLEPKEIKVFNSISRSQKSFRKLYKVRSGNKPIRISGIIIIILGFIIFGAGSALSILSMIQDAFIPPIFLFIALPVICLGISLTVSVSEQKHFTDINAIYTKITEKKRKALEELEPQLRYTNYYCSYCEVEIFTRDTECPNCAEELSLSPQGIAIIKNKKLNIIDTSKDTNFMRSLKHQKKEKEMKSKETDFIRSLNEQQKKIEKKIIIPKLSLKTETENTSVYKCPYCGWLNSASSSICYKCRKERLNY